MNKWINVHDRVPDSGELVIMYINTPRYQGSHHVTFGRYWTSGNGDNWWEPDGWLEGGEDIVSHWMPFPEPPVED